MAVGDDQFLLPHLSLQGTNPGRVGDFPDSVEHAVFVGYFDVRRCGGLKLGFNLSRIGIQHQDLFEMGLGCSQQFQAIGFGSGVGQLVGEDDFCGVVFKLAQGDEASPLDLFVAARNCEIL